MSVAPPVPDADDRVAVVGLACRFPGANDYRTFWENLRSGTESVRQLSEEELLEAGVSRASLDDPRYVRARGVLEHADRFDASCFGISPRDAELMDPQHRVFFECAWHALEDAGHDPRRFPGAIGVYAGAGLSTYLLNNLATDPDLVSGIPSTQVLVANDKDHVATHLAYRLGLHGPAITVQTACSTSLVAVHVAVQALLAGDCDMALAGGVSIAVPLVSGYLHQEGGILAADGHCRAFDAAATGTVGGNGAGVVVLRRYRDALRAGNTIRSVILGSAVNNDGGDKVGYTAPSVSGQEEVIATALAMAGASAESIGYVEAHGTGTTLGDPVEVEALTRAFRRHTERDGFCRLGSVKSNVGHLDAAAGVAGLIKTVLALEHAEIPPSLHFVEPNPRIDFAASPFRVVAELSPWPKPGDAPRRAGVSSFGMGGTNAHVVLEEPPAREPSRTAGGPVILPVSAHRADVAARLAARLARHLEHHADVSLDDVGRTLQEGRRALRYRAAVVAADRSEAAAGLEDAVVRTAETPPRVAFLLPGQGVEHAGMGTDLYRREPCYRAHVDACLDTLPSRVAGDLAGPLTGTRGAGGLDTTRLAQPALFVVEHSLARTLGDWGIVPDVVIGHSLGELVAATLAGSLSLEGGLELVVERGRRMERLPAGAMLAVGASPVDIVPLLGPEVVVAAVNDQDRCVVSGTEGEIDDLAERLRGQGVVVRRLPAARAFHSPMMLPAAEALAACARGLRLSRPTTPWISSVTGDRADEEVLRPEYWARQATSTVRFDKGLRTLLSEAPDVVVEVGPGTVLTATVRRCAAPDGRAPRVVTTLPDPGGDELTGFYGALAALWETGAELDWNRASPAGDGHLVPLPTYPFQRNRYWIGPGAGRRPVAASPAFRSGATLHVPGFRTLPPAPAPAPAAAGNWVVVGSEPGVGADLVERLAASGAEVTRARAAAGASGEEGVSARSDPAASVVAALKTESGLREVVYVACPPGVDDGSPAIDLLHLGRPLRAACRRGPVKLTLVTTGARAVTREEAVDPSLAACHAALRALSQELPGVPCRAIDVPVAAGDRAETLEELVAELHAPTPGFDVVLRPGRRWLGGFEAMTAAREARTSRLRADGTYVIFGGLGGVGLETASAIAAEGPGNLVLVGRSPFPPRSDWRDGVLEPGTRAAVDRLVEVEASSGCRITLLQGDVTDAEQVERVLDAVEESTGRLDGILLAAGPPKLSHPAISASAEAWRAQLDMRVEALQALQEATESRDLDFCLLQSSLSAGLGAVGFPAYAAAHGFMSAFAHERNRCGATPWIVVAWDNWLTWKEPRAVREAGATDHVTTEEGAVALREILGWPGVRECVVCAGDLSARLEEWVEAPARQHPRALAPREAEEAGSSRYPRTIDTPYRAPASPGERLLVEVWQEALGVQRIGIDDNFFELGGDSVTGIQVAARAREGGLAIGPEAIFEHQTIAELARVFGEGREPGVRAVPASRLLEAGRRVPLVPMQSWYLGLDRREPDRFNLTVVLESPERLCASALAEALDAVAGHHDVFHLRIRRGKPASTRQVFSEDPARIPLRVLEAEEDVEAAAEIAQSGLDLDAGPVSAALLARGGGGRPDRLIWIAHHMFVDALSWDILLRDLESAYAGLRSGRDFRLADPLTSFVAWADGLHERLRAGAWDDEVELWEELAGGDVADFPLDRPGGADTFATLSVLEQRLDAAATRRLVHALPAERGWRTADIVLAALAAAVRDRAGGPILVDVEGHGREPLTSALDPARTVGWLTTRFPLRVGTGEVGGPATVETLERLDRSMRRVPGGGLGYTALRELAASGPAGMRLRALPRAAVSFLYLGGARRQRRQGPFRRIREPRIGTPVAPAEKRTHRLEVTAEEREAGLVVTWAYGSEVLDRHTIVELTGSFQASLEHLMMEAPRRRGGPVGSFASSGLDDREIATLLARLRDRESQQDPVE